MNLIKPEEKDLEFGLNISFCKGGLRWTWIMSIPDLSRLKSTPNSPYLGAFEYQLVYMDYFEAPT